MDARYLLGALMRSGMGGRNPRLGGYGHGGGMGGGLGGLGAAMLGGRRATTYGTRGSGLQGALIGMLGGIAMSAVQRKMQERSAPPVTTSRIQESPAPSMAPSTGQPAQAEAEGADLDENRANLLIRVMVAAANADMRIDEEERARILGKLEESGADAEAKAFVEREMRRPMTLDEIGREITGPDVGAQVYAAALAAIDVDKAMERRFLQALAERAQLDPEIVAEIHEQLGQPQPTA